MGSQQIRSGLGKGSGKKKAHVANTFSLHALFCRNLSINGRRRNRSHRSSWHSPNCCWSRQPPCRRSEHSRTRPGEPCAGCHIGCSGSERLRLSSSAEFQSVCHNPGRYTHKWACLHLTNHNNLLFVSSGKGLFWGISCGGAARNTPKKHLSRTHDILRIRMIKTGYYSIPVR
jgi:hypothetical protein